MIIKLIQNLIETLKNFTINFGPQPPAAQIITTGCLFLSFFGALFIIGNPYLSLSIMVVCFGFLCWNFFRLIQTDLSFLNLVVLTSIASFLYTISGKFIYFILLAIEITILLLILSFLLSFFYPTMVKFTKISFISFLVCIFSLGLFLGLIKLYFFNAAVFLKSNHTQGYPLLFSDIPSNVYLSVKKYDFLDIQKNALFVLDFSSDTTLTDFAIQLEHFNPTSHLFDYIVQLIILDASWFPFHLTLIFT